MRTYSFWLLLLAVGMVFACCPAYAFEQGPLHLTYSERAGDAVSTKEYLVEPTGGGFRLTLFNRGVKRVILCDEAMDTYREEYLDTVGGDHLTVRRESEGLVLSGTLGGKQLSRTFEESGLWFGSVLLLRDFVLSGEDEILFLVTKPEEERVVQLKAIREAVETVRVAGQDVEAVRVKYTVPGFQGLFWKSYYWYRASDGLLVKTDEVRGMPGTPNVHTELVGEREVAPASGVALLGQ